MAGGPERNIYVLADRLKKLPWEIRAMPHRDLVGLVEFYNVAEVLADLEQRTEMHRAQCR